MAADIYGFYSNYQLLCGKTFKSLSNLYFHTRFLILYTLAYTLIKRNAKSPISSYNHDLSVGNNENGSPWTCSACDLVPHGSQPHHCALLSTPEAILPFSYLSMMTYSLSCLIVSVKLVCYL